MEACGWHNLVTNPANCCCVNHTMLSLDLAALCTPPGCVFGDHHVPVPSVPDARSYSEMLGVPNSNVNCPLNRSTVLSDTELALPLSCSSSTDFDSNLSHLWDLEAFPDLDAFLQQKFDLEANRPGVPPPKPER